MSGFKALRPEEATEASLLEGKRRMVRFTQGLGFRILGQAAGFSQRPDGPLTQSAETGAPSPVGELTSQQARGWLSFGSFGVEALRLFKVRIL